jgi:hypothetical protein
LVGRITIKEPVDTLDIGDDIGQFKLKKQGHIIVKNKRIYKWTEKGLKDKKDI